MPASSTATGDAPQEYGAAYRWSWTRRTILWADAASALGVSILYFLAAEAAFAVGTLTQTFAPFWPPNVVLLCVLLRVPRSRWPLYLVAVVPAHYLAELLAGMPVPQLFAAFFCNAVFAVLCAAALQGTLGPPPWCESLRKAILYLVIAAGAVPASVALLAGVEPMLGGGSPNDYVSYAWRWYLANALGSLTLTPAYLAWFAEPRHASESIGARRWFEAVLMTACLAVACTIAFGIATEPQGAHHFLPTLLYAPIPPMIWAAVRFGMRGATGSVLVVTLVAVWQAMQGHGPFASRLPEESVLALQVFLIVISIPTLLLAAVVEQLRAANEHLSRSEARFRAMAETVPGILFTSSPDQGCEYMSPRFYEYTGTKPDGALGWGWLEAIAPGDRERIVAARERAAKTGEDFDEECRIRSADGQYRWFLIRWHAFRDEAARTLRWFGAISDIDDMKHAADALRELSGQLLSAQDGERRRLARELHDGTAQNLLAASLSLAQTVGSSPEERSLLDKAQGLIDLSVQEIRTMSYLLHPPLLDECGIGAAIRWYVDGFIERTGISVELDVDPELSQHRPHVEIEMALFRVLQEALVNVHRHSGSRSVQIRLHVQRARGAEDALVVLAIVDEGTGMPGRRADRRSGVGLAGMRERLRNVGGYLRVSSSTRGTTVEATVPWRERPQTLSGAA